MSRCCPESLPCCLLLLSAVLLLGSSSSSSFEDSVLSCLRREYTLRATRTDRHGRTCWDVVKATSCWGRCDSFEIPDWRFPFKISHHPVCQYDRRVRRRVELRHCDPGAELRTYEFDEARSCACKLCNTSDTFCDWRTLHQHHRNHHHHQHHQHHHHRSKDLQLD